MRKLPFLRLFRKKTAAPDVFRPRDSPHRARRGILQHRFLCGKCRKETDIAHIARPIVRTSPGQRAQKRTPDANVETFECNIGEKPDFRPDGRPFRPAFSLTKKYARLRTFMFVWNIFKFVWQN